ncbi:MAG: cation transporter [Candidatus Kapabacteria bacterium]|nr:cation transporter [Ignavibacteriota bacterium]MCW5883759.1 cation transporter [Candidatus Kapabacteria bacterium]
MTFDLKKLPFVVIWASIILNVIIFAFKYYAGIEADSLAMIADAWHSLSDSITSFLVLFGYWYASRPADYEHPFGHGRAEPVVAIMIATLLGVIGFEFIKDAVVRIQEYKIVTYSTSSVIMFSITIVIKELMALTSIYVGKKVKSESLIADGWHHRTDAISTVIIVIGAIFGGGIWWLDSAMTFMVSVMLFWVAYQIIRTSANTLLGENPNHELKEKIMRIAKDVNPAITSVHHFRLHNYGEHKELNIDIRLPSEMSVLDAHVIASAVEKSIYFQLKMKTTVHVEPGLNSIYLKNSNYF